MIRPPHIATAPNGCPVLVDASGQVHTPRELVRAVYNLEDQARISLLWDQNRWARTFHEAATQRRAWLRWLEGRTE